MGGVSKICLAGQRRRRVIEVDIDPHRLVVRSVGRAVNVDAAHPTGQFDGNEAVIPKVLIIDS